MNRPTTHSMLVIGIGIIFFLAAVVLVLKTHWDAFYVGCSIALVSMGFTAVRSGMYLASLPNDAPRRTKSIQSFGSWWRTPKVYPNGSAFAPRDHAFFGLIVVLCLVILVWLMGWSVQTLTAYFSHAARTK